MSGKSFNRIYFAIVLASLITKAVCLSHKNRKIPKKVHTFDENDYHEYGLRLVNNYRCKYQGQNLHLSPELNEKALLCAKHMMEKESQCPDRNMIDADSNGYSAVTLNFYKGNITDAEMTDVEMAREAIDEWANGGQYYDFNEDSIKEGADKVVGENFMQLVWYDIQDVGFGLRKSKETRTFYFVMFLGPPIQGLNDAEERSTNMFPCNMEPCKCLDPQEEEEVHLHNIDADLSSANSNVKRKVKEGVLSEIVTTVLYFTIFYTLHFLL